MSANINVGLSVKSTFLKGYANCRVNKKNINKKIVNLDINSLEELKKTGYIKKIPVCPESRTVTYNGTKMDKNGKVKCGDSLLSEYILFIDSSTHGSLIGK